MSNWLYNAIARRAVRRLATQPLPMRAGRGLNHWVGFALVLAYFAVTAFLVTMLAMEVLQ